MHEYHAVESIVKQIIDKASKNNAVKVNKVNLALGELVGFEEGSVRFYFEDLSKGTLLEGAELTIETVKPKLRCKDCGALFEKKKEMYNCPKCNKSNLEVESGKDFYIKYIEIP